MANQRDPIAVIDAVLEQIPADAQWDVLRERLASVRESACYRAPDAQRMTWIGIANVLIAELGIGATTDWQREISYIVQGRRPAQAEGETT